MVVRLRRECNIRTVPCSNPNWAKFSPLEHRGGWLVPFSCATHIEGTGRPLPDLLEPTYSSILSRGTGESPLAEDVISLRMATTPKTNRATAANRHHST